MQKLVVSFVFVCCFIPVVASGGGGDKKADAKLNPEGSWVVVAMEENGMKTPVEAIEKLNMKLTLKGDSYTVTMAGSVIDKGTSKSDMQKKPITVDIKSEEGPNKGKTMLAIVELDGDTMKACYAMDGKDRPTEFSAKEGSGRALITYKKEAAKK
jgi:uncharacterized protein (TIGR03067 family)